MAEIMWEQGGFSMSQIAESLGVTRNAVAGYLHRSGVSKFGNPPKSEAKAKKRGHRAPRIKPEPERIEIQIEEAVEEEILGLGLLDLKFTGQCKFAVSSDKVGKHEHIFCGRRIVSGMVYCADHAKIAFRKATSQERLMTAKIKKINRSKRWTT